MGEISLSRMEFSAAREAFTNAYHEDETPLSLMSLAELYWRFGMLDAAQSHLDEAAGWKDDSWMYYFGIDPVIVRLIAILLAFSGGGIIAYVVACVIVPEEPES